ncbi:MAG: nickel pincer cofactor biosynthesis protein LarB [Lachnospiraceae bacterium]|nr:nickel pincer cofactor biosynthesis protein LarB [Lachnospiraceae bacterium]
MEIKEILEQLKEDKISLEQAEIEIKDSQYEDFGFAKIDHNRKKRMGTAEVVFCQGKPDEYLADIYQSILKNNGEVLGTRATKSQYEVVRKEVPGIEYNEISRVLKIEKVKEHIGNIVICTGGTADIPVAEEAAQTAEFFGSAVERVYDVGVSGIHRVLSNREKFDRANVIIVIAGMEGALSSVVGGLVKVPVIAVPTSIGYGANFGGLAALLSMINSCSNGVSVVNIDNGYGAGYIANQINRLACGTLK